MRDALAEHRQAGACLADDALPRTLAERLIALRPGPFPFHPDPHLVYIRVHDAPRSAARAERMLGALTAVRRRAEASAPLTFDLLRTLQGLVLGATDVPLRGGDAFAKGGAERYGFDRGLRRELDARLASTHAHPVLAATAAYLDLCFYHPFPDGNARAARLAFDFILWHARIPIADLRPVFAVPRVAGDADSYLDFLRLVIRLCERASRAPQSCPT